MGCGLVARVGLLARLSQLGWRCFWSSGSSVPAESARLDDSRWILRYDL